MASAFGDQSYPKLPPIRKGSVKETQATGKDQMNAGNPSSFSRETHGLVRLPPIIRVDASASSPVPAEMSYTENDEEILENFATSRFANKTKKDDHNSKNNNNCENHRNKELNRRNEPTKRQIIQETTNNSNESITDSHLDQDDIRKPSHFETDKVYGYVRRESKPASLLSTNQGEYRRRRGSLIISEPEKPLHRGRRLAKSSPDLSSTRKQYGSPVRETKKTDRGRIDLESFHAGNEFIRVADHGNSRLQRSGKGKVANRIVTQRQSLKNRWEFPSQPQSSPCTPVVQLINDEPMPREQQQRNSLGDIYASKERKLSINSRRKLPPKEENRKSSLMVEGKTCPQNERLTPRISSPRHTRDSFLKIPQTQTKRDSLYDLEQILSLLNIESRSGKTLDSRKKSSSSVYDLQEFLEMSRPTSDSASSTDNAKKRDENQPNTSELLSSLEIEKTDNRRGSTYDLSEFLCLNVKAKGKEQSGQDTATGNTAPSHFLFPNEGNKTESGQMRRSSAYDLMEFLSLSGQTEEISTTSDSNQSQPLQSKTLSFANSTESPNQPEDLRKGSIYDLEEFLYLSRESNSTVPKVPDKEAGPQASPLLLPPKFKLKRESIYDLQEFLGVLQKESELKRHPVKSTESDSTIQDTKQLLHSDSDLLTPADEPHKGRSLSIYDLREFLSIYSSQSNVGNQFRRKQSEISQSSIMVNVTEDEHGNGSIDDVFLAVPVEGGAGRKRSSIASVAELNELLNILNDTTRKKSISGAPTPVTRHDSGGTKSLMDLGEFLSFLNTDDSPLRRRLSSVSDRGNRSPSALSRNDSSGGSSLYDLEEFLAVINDSGQVKSDAKGKQENQSEEISIAVPQLPCRVDRTANDQIGHLSLLTEVNTKTTGSTTDGQKTPLEHCL